MKEPEVPTPPETDPKDDLIAAMQNQLETLQAQLQSMEDFANEVVTQRNNAYNESAQLRSQLVRQLKGATQ